MTNLAVCRLCLTDRDPTFLELKQDSDLIDTIFNVLSFEPMPHSIDTIVLCPDCQLFLTQVEQFREGCIHNDEIFRERLQSEESMTTVYVKEDNVDGLRVVIIEEDEAQQLGLIDEAGLEKEVVQQSWPDEEQEVKEDVAPSIPEEKNESVRQTRQRKAKQVAPKREPPKKPQNKPELVVKQEDSPAPAAVPTKPKRKFVAATSNRYLPCVRCGKMLRRSNMVKHLETHDPKPPQLFCSYCGKQYRDPNLLKVHINSHHTFERKYECEECGKVYYRPNSLREHILANHSKELRYECKHCGMKFSNFSKRTYHYATAHSEARPYSCQYCDRAFKLRSDWTLHVRTHTGEKPFSCDICGKRFNKSYNVTIHKKSHRNEEARKALKEAKAQA
ncbi:AGAP011674-PA [Anopheles gambiae str. PEST]|uniref:AGAP011674-PA n=1 Tax=Anopheles gambiae TaxID=7165 RepID=Q5TMJ4_ANOGA|nr:AGAP011674-PA [Anopheles gambiae str. PEST]